MKILDIKTKVLVHQLDGTQHSDRHAEVERRAGSQRMAGF